MDPNTLLAGTPLAVFVPFLIVTGKLLTLMGGAAAVAAMIPHPSATAPWPLILLRRLLDGAAANWGNAKNATVVALPPVLPPTAAAGFLAMVGMALALAACTDKQISDACKYDKALQPGVAAVAGAVDPKAATVVALDIAVIHPLVVGGCDTLAPAKAP